MKARQFCNRPIQIEAEQWTGDNAQELIDWTNSAFQPFIFAGTNRTAQLFVRADENYAALETGEWVIKDEQGFWPCKADAFERTFYEVEPFNRLAFDVFVAKAEDQ